MSFPARLLRTSFFQKSFGDFNEFFIGNHLMSPRHTHQRAQKADQFPTQASARNRTVSFPRILMSRPSLADYRNWPILSLSSGVTTISLLANSIERGESPGHQAEGLLYRNVDCEGGFSPRSKTGERKPRQTFEIPYAPLELHRVQLFWPPAPPIQSFESGQ